jgi:predicted transcriptional regulator
MTMTIELPGTVEKELRTLAAKRGQDIGALLEAAVRQYLEAEAITDLDAEEIPETQMALIGELRDLPEWK